MRYPTLLTIAAFLAACTPAPAGAPPVPEAPAPGVPLATSASAAPEGPGPAAATAADAPAAPAATNEVVLTGLVDAPEDLRAPGDDRAVQATGRSLLATRSKPLAKAPVRILDPVSRKVLGTGVTDEAGRYRIVMGVGLAADGQTLLITVGAVAPNGKAVELVTLSRMPAAKGAQPDRPDAQEMVAVTLASTVLSMFMLTNSVDKGKDLAPLNEAAMADYLTAITKIQEAFRDEDFNTADLSDPDKVSRALTTFVRGDATLKELVKNLGPATPKSGGGGAGGGPGGNPGEDPDPTLTPILSGTIR